MNCPKCNGKLNKDGINQSKKQKWKCPNCGFKSTLNPLGRPKIEIPCSICGLPSKAKGLCNKHYKAQAIKKH